MRAACPLAAARSDWLDSTSSLRHLDDELVFIILFNMTMDAYVQHAVSVAKAH